MIVMPLFTDKYVPCTFEDLHSDCIADRALKAYSRYECNDTPHMLFLGPRGCGKKIRVLLYLNNKYGLNPNHIKTVYMRVKHPTKPVMLRILQSSYHQQICPSVHEVYDRTVLKDFLGRTVSYKSVGLSNKLIVIEDADKLSKNAQQGLRRVLEKHVGTCRFILIATNEHRLIDALKSRCLVMRFPAPTNEYIKSVLVDICEKEDLRISDNCADAITIHSRRNIKEAVKLLNIMSISPATLIAVKVDPKKHDTIREGIYDVVRLLFSCNNVVSAMDDIRNKFFLLVSHRVPLDYVITQVCLIFIDQLVYFDREFAGRMNYSDLRVKLIKCAIDHRRSILCSSQPIFHIESFLLRVFIMIKELQKCTK